METKSVTREKTELEDQVLALLRQERSIMFSALAEAFPEYRWQALFTALRRLSDRQAVECVPYRWDYQLVLRHRDGR